MDRLEAMSTFLAVVEAGSLSAAARKLKTPLATVSRKISELESHLRTRLFTRSSRKLMLIDAERKVLTVLSNRCDCSCNVPDKAVPGMIRSSLRAPPCSQVRSTERLQ
jgi:Bacterial regulatory helix-turn-helix protein, lysR family